ncbi:hypothetical protein GCM10008110_12530 [Marinobacter persicus]|nr:hypothetical protein GCM10008110_12530 [Marinobacter persicus]
MDAAVKRTGTYSQRVPESLLLPDCLPRLGSLMARPHRAGEWLSEKRSSHPWALMFRHPWLHKFSESHSPARRYLFIGRKH